MTKPRLVIVTAGDANGRRLTQALARHAIRFETILIAHNPPRRPQNRWQVVRAHLAANPVLRSWWQRKLLPFASKPFFGGFCNSDRMKAWLHTMAPDYILMMGGGLIDGEVISAARCGVLNAHPGLLPWLRGVDVLRHAVDREVPMGVTGHFIDVGIDTGAVIEQVRLTVRPGDSHEDIQHRADLVCVGMMTALSLRVWQGEQLIGVSQSEHFPYCKAMSVAQAKNIDVKILSGSALELQDREPWQTRFCDDEALFQLCNNSLNSVGRAG